VGLNIQLNAAQACNDYATKSITFHHFFIRKLMLVKYATSFIIMPGGLGTLDELTEVLTLMQTEKIKPFPVVLFGSDYWKGFLTWLSDTVLARQFITSEDLNLLRVCDKPEEVVDIVQSWYIKQELIGKRALK